MTDTQTQVANWDDVQQTTTDFVKFKAGVKQVFAIKNWTLFWAEEPDFNDKQKKVRKVKFNCEVIGEDGKLVSKKISTSSSRFINAVKPKLQGKQPTTITFLAIAKIGEGNGTNYFVEDATPTELIK